MYINNKWQYGDCHDNYLYLNVKTFSMIIISVKKSFVYLECSLQIHITVLRTCFQRIKPNKVKLIDYLFYGFVIENVSFMIGSFKRHHYFLFQKKTIYQEMLNLRRKVLLYVIVVIVKVNEKRGSGYMMMRLRVKIV